MSPAVPTELRKLVAERARHACEYCGIPESFTYFGCQKDQHRQTTSLPHGRGYTLTPRRRRAKAARPAAATSASAAGSGTAVLAR
jgi:hypothetical protein